MPMLSDRRCCKCSQRSNFPETSIAVCRPVTRCDVDSGIKRLLMLYLEEIWEILPAFGVGYVASDLPLM